MESLWVGVDAGKQHHHAVVIDFDGARKLSRRVANDEASLVDLVETVGRMSGDGEVTWA
ncbi:MAG: transposase [Rhodococcus sp. (in: high G+C Gram-positive bacteria)]|mgnify:CR=1 FL=1